MKLCFYKRIYRAALTAFFICAAVQLTAQESSWYLGKPITEITFDGLKHVRATDIEGVTSQYIGEIFTDELFFELLGALYGLEFFEEIRPATLDDASRNGVVINFSVTERPVLSRITFSGNAGLRRSEMLDAITLKPQDVVNSLKIRMDEQAIHAKYLEKGYVDAKVSSETQTNKDGSVILTFKIDEGERVTIEAIRFEGNSIFSERKLRAMLSLRPKGFMQDGAFQEAKLTADRQTLVQYYHDRGYIDASIVDITRDVSRDAKGSRLTLTFRLREGRKYTFGGVTITGNTIFSTETLQKLVYSKPKEEVNARKLEADLQRISDRYYDDGYIFNTISREEIKEDGVLSYNLNIVERNRAHIESIIVRGNKKTHNEVILREMPLEEGDVFSKIKVLEGIRNLYNLQYFSNIIPETPPGSAENLMNLVINVEEQFTTDIQAGVTFSGTTDPNALPVSILLKWTDRNFLGWGNIFGVEVNASDATQNASLQYTHRWLFGLPLSGGFDFTVQHQQRWAAMNNHAPFFNGDETYAYPDGFSSYNEYAAASKLPADEYLMSYEQWRFSLGFSTGYRWLTFLGNLGVGGNLRGGFKINSYDAELYRPFDPTLRQRNNEPTPSTSFSVSVSLDNRDIYYDPSKGYYLLSRFGLYGLLPNKIEDEYYMRNELKAEVFFTLWNIPVTETWAFKGVFGVHSGLSFLFPYMGNSAPVAEDANKLYIDGMFTGRGWTDQRSNRGFAMWENWAELRMPALPGVLAVDLFFDMAEVASEPAYIFKNDPVDVENGGFFDRMHFSFGGGLRFAIPQFPFRFLFLKRFKIADGGGIEWQRGAIGGNASDPASGIDFVLSFALSTY